MAEGGHLGPLSYLNGYRGGVGRSGVGQDTTREDGIKIRARVRRYQLILWRCAADFVPKSAILRFADVGQRKNGRSGGQKQIETGCAWAVPGGRPGPHHGPSSATELSSRREDVLATSRPAVHGICDRRGRFDRRMHNKLTRDDVHCTACRDRPKLRARSHELRRGGPIISMWTSAAPDIKSNWEILGHI